MPGVPIISSSSALRTVDAPGQLHVPCAIESPLGTVRLRPAGTIVARGESLAESSAEEEHSPLAPAAGRIAGTTKITLTNGREALAGILEAVNDPASKSSSDASLPLPSTEATRSMLASLHSADVGAKIDHLRACGVWADRWTSPRLLQQLHHCLERSVDTIVCNLLEADPSLAVNRACAAAHGPEIVAAIAALARVTGAARVWAVVDDAEPPTTWNALRDAAAAVANDLRIVPVENDYPQADPTLLIYTLTRRKMRSDRLPTHRGVLLFDAAAAVAIGRALLLDEPMLRVPVAIHDQMHGNSHLLWVPIGARLGDVIAELGMPAGRLELRGGGPLREVRLTEDCIISSGELGIFACPREPDVNPQPCTRCGWCVEGCPTRINPAGLLDAAQQDDLALASRWGIEACIECGVCSYVCPSDLPILGGIKRLRAGNQMTRTV